MKVFERMWLKVWKSGIKVDFDLEYLNVSNEFSNEILYDNTLKWVFSNDTFGSKKELKLLINWSKKSFQNHLCYFEFKVNDDDEKCELLRTKSTLWWPGGHVTWSRGSRDPEGKPLERNPYVMRSAHSPPPRVTCKVAKVVVWFHYLIDSAEKTLWVKEPLWYVG